MPPSIWPLASWAKSSSLLSQIKYSPTRPRYINQRQPRSQEARNTLFTSHVIGVCLHSQSALEKHNQEKKHKHKHKPLCNWWISQKLCLPCLIIKQSCYLDYRMNKPFTCSRCVICVSCSVHVISTYYMRKGSWAFFYLNYPQTNEVRDSDHVPVPD